MAGGGGLSGRTGGHGGLRRRGALRVALLAAGALVGCSRSTDAGYGPPVGATPSAASARAPEIRLARLAVAGGTQVEPVTGLLVTLVEGARALTPESLGDGRASVTYVWPDDSAWGYLVVEGPIAFTGTTEDASHAVGQELLSQGALPSAEQSLPWEGFEQCHQLTWAQEALLPGWEEETAVDAVEIFLADASARTFTLTVLVPRGGLAETSVALLSMCSATAAPA